MGDRRIIFCFQKNDIRNHSQYDLSISVLKLEIRREVSGKTGMKLNLTIWSWQLRESKGLVCGGMARENKFSNKSLVLKTPKTLIHDQIPNCSLHAYSPTCIIYWHLKHLLHFSSSRTSDMPFMFRQLG